MSAIVVSPQHYNCNLMPSDKLEVDPTVTGSVRLCFTMGVYSVVERENEIVGDLYLSLSDCMRLETQLHEHIHHNIHQNKDKVYKS